ncbi:MAG TPA: hypothetical protein VN887_19620 [Candidatus Angelobacter sp.]|nr:hypothetical protein [Candidatus Angelobacter sp.]
MDVAASAKELASRPPGFVSFARQMTGRKTFRIAAAVFGGCCVWAGQAELVYQDIGSTNSQPTYFPSTAEYGDELHLAGTGRNVIQFGTEYFSDVPSTNGTSAIIRFYANDGPGSAPAPGTLLYQSDPFPVAPGYNSVVLHDFSVTVPDVFTFTIQFGGLGTNQAGLLAYDPPSVGFSYNDFWMHTGTNWGLFQLGGGIRANFAARVIAQDVLAARLQAPVPLADGRTRIPLTGPSGWTCVMQSSLDLTNWSSIGIFNFAGLPQDFFDATAPRPARNFYRALTTMGGPMTMTTPVQTNGQTQFQVSGPENLTFVIQTSPDLANWSDALTNKFGPRPFVFLDPSPPVDHRFYRTRLRP